MDDAAAIAEVRLCIEVGNYQMDEELCDEHMFNEGFAFHQAVQVALTGDVIEAGAARNRWLFCGTVEGMRLDSRFRGRWLHVCVERDEATGVAIVTMYRPLVRLWRTERDRR